MIDNHMPEENPKDSPSALKAEKSNTDAGKQPPLPTDKKNSSRFYRLWLLLGTLALGIAIFFSLESKLWQDAQYNFREWIEWLNLDSDFAQSQPELQETPLKVSQQPQVSVTSTAPASAASSEKETTIRQHELSLSPAIDSTILLERRLGPIERQIRQLQTNAQQMYRRMDLFAERQSDLEGRIGLSSPYAKRAALALGLLQLSIASANGAPFEAERQTLSGLLPENDDIAALQLLARGGVASEASLLLEVPSLVDEIAASQEVNEDLNLWNWFKSWITGLVQIRRLDAISAQGRDGILARMEHAAQASNLDDALAAALLLRDADRKLVADWINAVRGRLELRTRIEALSQVVASADTTRIQ